MHVGRVFGKDESEVRPIPEWDMKIPDPITALCNKYETGQVALCGLFSETVKKASMSQYNHLQGEINAITKLDRHYHGLFGFTSIIGHPTKKLHDSFTVHFEAKNSYSCTAYFFV